MKLHDVVELREVLKTVYSIGGVEQELDQLIDNIRFVKDKYGEDYSWRFGQVIDELVAIKDSLKEPLNHIDNMSAMAEMDLQDATEKFRLPTYQDELRYGNPNAIREIRKLYIPNGVDEIVRQAIDLYVDWKYPGLEIGCRDGDFTQYMVSLDPLYITDDFQEFIDSTKSKFPVEYQRRLRPYLTTNMDLSKLPKNQIGFAFSWNYFNYITLENIEHYLVQVFDLLRPGGAFMFSYNNTELPAAAAYADSYYMSYVPKAQLLAVCEKIGYELISSTDLEPAVSWVEIKKPGELKTIKTHQVLGEIKYQAP